MRDAPVIHVVSGLPRSGTSLMMQMIAAGGIDPVTDAVRAPDDDNPRGYYEFERAKQIKSDKAWLPDAVGRVVKLVHILLPELPGEFAYRVVFMRRDLDEVARSQALMLQRLGRTGAQLSPEALKKTYQQQLDRVLGWLAQQPNFQTLEVWYQDVVRDPEDAARTVNAFLGGHLDTARMREAVDPSLYRNRAS